MNLKALKQSIADAELVRRSGKLTHIYGLTLESDGPDAFLGELCVIQGQNGKSVNAEVVALKDGRVYLMPYSDLTGIYLGSNVYATGKPVTAAVGYGLLGRVINAFGLPLDGKPLNNVDTEYPLHAAPVNPLHRSRIKDVMETGVKTIDAFLTLGRGQRIGIFAGSGVGKSTLLGMIARNVRADINVIALVGERGREVKDFIDKSLGQEGLSRSIVVVATSDETALTRVHAALSATAIAEYFRDQGKHVMLLMDSVTRYAMALREIGLAVGEPPTARGYTPTVFSSLPKLTERCGSSIHGGTITAIYTVLVEGDDINDPVADNLRAILDGHFVLSRDLANQGQYPSIDILQSNSRLLNDLLTNEELSVIKECRKYINLYTGSKDMIDLGAYKHGTNPELDKAIRLASVLMKFMGQEINYASSRVESMSKLKEILNG